MVLPRSSFYKAIRDRCPGDGYFKRLVHETFYVNELYDKIAKDFTNAKAIK